jgi:MFS family permease
LPVGILALIATLRVLHEPVRHNPGRFDPLGAGLLGVGLACLTGGLSFGQERGWTSAPILLALGVGIVALVLLPLVELRVPNPIIVLSLLRSRVFASAIISLVLSFLALFAVSFMLPFYLEELRGFNAEQAGWLLTPLPITIALLAPFSGTLADRLGSRWLAAGGLTIACAGLVLISGLDAQSSVWDIVWRLVVTGIGQALFQTPNNSALLGAAPRTHQGSASGFLATGRVVGQSMSIALAGAVFAGLGGAAAGGVLAGARHGGPAAPDVAALQATFVQSFHATFLVCAAIAAIGIFTSLVRGPETPHRA